MRRRSPPPLFVVIAAVVALAGLAVAALRDGDTMLYNHSPSLPTGLYVRSEGPIARDTVVTVRAVDVAPAQAHARGFAGARDRFLKRVAALSGDEVCAHGDAITINGIRAANRHAYDSGGQSLPRWTGCRTLAARDIFLLGDTGDSFDGRYWGVVSRDLVEGVWRPLIQTAATATRTPHRAKHAFD